MKRFRKQLGLMLLAAAALVAPAHAVVISTGPGPDYGGGVTLYDTRPDGTEFSRVAGMFRLFDPATITSVAGWLNWNYPGELIFSIASDIKGLPGETLLSQVVHVPTTELNHPDWRGAYGLDWQVERGAYWLIIAAAPSQRAFGSMPQGPVANPLAGYAYDYTFSEGFARVDSAQVGMRIVTSPIPEPESLLLLSLGLPLLTLARKRGIARGGKHPTFSGGCIHA